MDEGMMAVICVEETDAMGAEADAPLTLTCTEVPPSEPCRGSAACDTGSGPRLLPLMTKMEPWAMAELGRPALAWLAAFKTADMVGVGAGGGPEEAVRVYVAV